jgi:hypothetical protein
MIIMKLSDGLTMTYDELWNKLSPESKHLIESAGFVLVPRKWREEVWDHLESQTNAMKS